MSTTSKVPVITRAKYTKMSTSEMTPEEKRKTTNKPLQTTQPTTESKKPPMLSMETVSPMLAMGTVSTTVPTPMIHQKERQKGEGTRFLIFFVFYVLEVLKVLARLRNMVHSGIIADWWHVGW